jgi:alpha-tubulin suppressor-like RCC1 family protein
VCASGSVAQGSCVPVQGAIALAAGAHHSCALLADGSVRCWGARDQVGAGDGFAAQFAANPVPVCRQGSSATGDCSALTAVTAIAVGSWHSCALLDDGGAVCWGWGWLGALGNGQQELGEVRRNPVPVCSSGSTGGGDCVPATGLAALAAGNQYSCALRDDQQALCWGSGGQGQLGDPRAGSGYTAVHPGDVCLTTVNNLCLPFDDAALRRCVELVVEVAP